MILKNKKKTILSIGLLLALIGSGSQVIAEQGITQEKYIPDGIQITTEDNLAYNLALRAGSNFDSRAYRYLTDDEFKMDEGISEWAFITAKLFQYSTGSGSMPDAKRINDEVTQAVGTSNVNDISLGLAYLAAHEVTTNMQTGDTNTEFEQKLEQYRVFPHIYKQVMETYDTSTIYGLRDELVRKVGNGAGVWNVTSYQESKDQDGYTKYDYSRMLTDIDKHIIESGRPGGYNSNYTVTITGDGNNYYTVADSENNREDMKNHVSKYGALSAKIYRNDNFFKTTYTVMQEDKILWSVKSSEYGVSNEISYRYYYGFSERYIPQGPMYYYNGDKNVEPNHNVLIIGWDDNFSNALTNVPNKGAWLVADINPYSYRISTRAEDYYSGAEFGRHQSNPWYAWNWKSNFNKTYISTNYYWVPYDDMFIESNVCGIGNVGYKDYDTVYQYDELGMSATTTGAINAGDTQISTMNTSIYGANVFTREKEEAERLTAISVASDIPQKYEVYVNPRINSEKDIKEQLIAENFIKVATTDVLSAGYNTIRFDTDKNIYLTSDKFAVAVKCIADSNSDNINNRIAKIGIESPKTKDGENIEFYENATSAPYQSYTSIDMNSWGDLYDVSETKDANLCIKAFAKDAPYYKPQVEKLKIIDGQKENDESIMAQYQLLLKTEEEEKLTVEVIKGDEHQLGVEVDPDNIKDLNITWMSSNQAIATVDQEGKVTGKANGEVTITAMAGGVVDTCTVKVIVPVESVSLNQSEVTIYKDGTYVLGVLINPLDATVRKIQWTSANPEVCRVTDSGVLIGMQQGITSVTGLLIDTNGKYYSVSCKVNVPETIEPDVQGISLNKTSLILEVGQRETLEATITPESATNKAIIWSSSDTDIVAVNDVGRLTALKTGTAKITATTLNGGKQAICNVTVKAPTVVNVQSISLNKTNLTMEKGKSETLVATITPLNSTNKVVKWTSSNMNVAVVGNDGKVTIVGEGTATITAKTEDGGKTATCQVTGYLPFVSVNDVKLDKSAAVLNASNNDEKTIQLNVIIYPYNATNKDVTWQSSDPSIATVDQTGKVTALKKGTVEITVTSKDGNISKTCIIKIDEDISITSFTITDSNGNELTQNSVLEIAEGLATEIKVVGIVPTDTTDTEVQITSSNEQIVRIINGKLYALTEEEQNDETKGLTEKTAIVTVKCGNIEKSFIVKSVKQTTDIKVTSNNYLITDKNIVTDIPLQTSISEFIESIKVTATNEVTAKILDIQGNDITQTAPYIGTGMKLVLTTKVEKTDQTDPTNTIEETVNQEYSVIVKGDMITTEEVTNEETGLTEKLYVVGDGVQTSKDLSMAMSMVVGTEKITDSNLIKYIDAIDYDNNGKINVYDLNILSDSIVNY